MNGRRLLSLVVLALAVVGVAAERGVGQEYQRPVDVAPVPEDIGGGYATPEVQRPLPRGFGWQLVDMTLLAGWLGASAWLVLRRRSRRGVVCLAIGGLLYFGFFREGCICSIGAIQNVTLAFYDPRYAVPYVVIVFFFLPLLAALLFGRVFCGGVCPLGAIQELVVLRPVRIPLRLDKLFGLFKYLYLAAAIWFVLQPEATRDFIICRFDPYVGLFRRSGPASMILFGGGMLLLGTVVGRPYCRYLCPYGALLAIVSRFAWRGVTITPDEELDCGLCADACPYGAIERMRAVRANCLFCARCYAACPRTLRVDSPPSKVG